MKRIVVFFIFMGLFSTAYQLGSMAEVDDEEAQKFLEEFGDIITDIDSIGIFIHNVTIALPMFIPGFGVAWGLFSGWSTGYAFASVISQVPEFSQIPALTLLYLSPFGAMELVAYSIGISRSYILIKMIIKKTNLRPAIRGTSIEIGIMVGLLLAGGFLEFFMIEIAQESGYGVPGF